MQNKAKFLSTESDRSSFLLPEPTARDVVYLVTEDFHDHADNFAINGQAAIFEQNVPVKQSNGLRFSGMKTIGRWFRQFDQNFVKSPYDVNRVEFGIMALKGEPMDDHPIEPIELEDKILALCGEFPEGLPDGVIQQRISNVTAQQRAAAINRLLAQAKLDLLKSGNALLYKARNLANVEKIKGATNEETIIYHIIEEAGNRGIWVRDIRVHSNLPQAQLNKVLKNLESRKLVKSIKSVGAARKKIYMLFELEPDIAVTGGTFYSDQEVDMQFVDLLNQQCLKYLRGRRQFAYEKHLDPMMRFKSSFVSSMEVARHINDLKISKVELTVKDMERVLDTLVFDGTAERGEEQGDVEIQCSNLRQLKGQSFILESIEPSSEKPLATAANVETSSASPTPPSRLEMDDSENKTHLEKI